MTPDIERYLADSLSPPVWATGHISHADGRFLESLIRRGVRQPVLEIGVASGWSSTVLLSLLNRNRPIASQELWLRSYDVAEWCYFDPSRKVGAAVGEVAPQLAPYWKLHVGNAMRAGEDLRGTGIDLAFIDADHRHPWATLDLLALLPALAADAWVALHDINLPGFAERAEWHVFGPKYLFDLWPWEKCIAGGDRKNIGAVRLPGDHEVVRALCDTVLGKPWETPVAASILAAVGVAPKEGFWIQSGTSEDALPESVQAIVREGRPLVLWGAGSAGVQFLRRNPTLRPAVQGIVDNAQQKHGTSVEGIRVMSPTEFWARKPRPFVIITSQYAGEILQALEKQGFRAQADYLAMSV